MKERKLLWRAALLAAFILAPAAAIRADPFTLALDPSRTVAPGGTMSYFGSLTNAGAPARFLSSVSVVIAYAGPGTLIADDAPFFANTPASLGPGGMTGAVVFFDVTASSGVFLGSYTGSFTVTLEDEFGAAVLATREFVINVAQPRAAPVPEPATLALLGTGLAGIVGGARRRGFRRRLRSEA